ALRRAPGPTTPITITKQNGQTVDLQVAPLQVTQPITAHLVRHEDLPAAGTQPASSCYEADVVLVFDVTVEATSGSAELCTELAGIEAAVSDPVIAAALQSLVSGQAPATCSEFDLTPLEEMTGGTSPVVNAGLSADGAFVFVAIRLEVHPAAAGTETAWASFYAGAISNNLFGVDWSV